MEPREHLKSLCHRSVGEVVAEDYRRAYVFKRFGIDFCCGGDRVVLDACTEKGVSCDELLAALADAERVPLSPEESGAQPDVRAWPPDFLASYIVNVHHRYLRERIPLLRELTQTVARVHGADHPEAIRIAQLFDALGTELEAHTDREEQELFPYITALVTASGNGGRVEGSPDVSDQTVDELMEDHDHAGAAVRELRSLTHDYTPPSGACNTYRMTYGELEAFEADLHRHVHLENNVLFPQVRRLRRDLEVA